MSHHRNPCVDSNVIDLPPPYGKTLPRERAGEFLVQIRTYTDLIGGPINRRQYAIEDLLVDPDAELEDGCLIVAQFAGSPPRLMGFVGFMGRDHNGRFVPVGDPRECYTVTCGLRVARSEKTRIFRIIGRLVGEPRRFPRVG